MKTVIQKLFVLCLLLSSTTVANAEDCSKEYKKMATEQIKMAQANGWKTIGGVSLQTIIDDINAPDFFYDCDPIIKIKEQGRHTAYYSPLKRRIHLYPDFKSHGSSTQGAIVLHEALGIKKYKDKEFQNTIRILQMQKTPYTQGSLLEKSDIDARGGTDGVGGGGDAFSVVLKMTIFEGLAQMLESLPEERRLALLNEVLELPITVFQKNLSDLKARTISVGLGMQGMEFGFRSVDTPEGAEAVYIVALSAATHNLETRKELQEEE